MAEPSLPQVLALEVGGPALYAASGGEALRPGQAWQVRGLLTDPVNSGWRRDLSKSAGLAEATGPEMAQVLSGSAWSQLPSRGRPLCAVIQAERRLSTLPLLSDFRLSLGFFNSRHDGRHRLRFHGSGVLWNPLTVPVLAGQYAPYTVLQLERWKEGRRDGDPLMLHIDFKEREPFSCSDALTYKGLIAEIREWK